MESWRYGFVTLAYLDQGDGAFFHRQGWRFNMLHKLTKLALPLVALASAVPALADHPVSVVESACVSVTHPAGCLFEGNASLHDTPAIEAAYNAVRDPNISLGFVLETGVQGPWEITFGDSTQTFGTWTLLDGVSADFLGVKADGGFTLFRLDDNSTSGTWSTAGIFETENGPHALSHLAFWNDTSINGGGGEVPEPSTWLMLIAGFGLTGAVARRRAARLHRVSA